jgi:hypothetical protein
MDMNEMNDIDDIIEPSDDRLWHDMRWLASFIHEISVLLTYERCQHACHIHTY